MLSRRYVLRLLAALPLIGTAMSSKPARASGSRYYDGPVSDHFDGTHFFDPHGAPPKSLDQLLRWWWEGGRATWPEEAPSSFADTPPPRVEGAAIRLSFVGHASFLIQTAGLNILTDPVWSQRMSPVSFAGPKRVNPPGIAFEKLPKIDVVLVSHGHYDHLDLETLSRLAAAHNPRVITPLGNDTIMKGHDPAIRAEAWDWGDRVDLGNDVIVDLQPMRHWTARGLRDRNHALWAAFVLHTPAGRIYHVGDSGYGEGHHFRQAKAKYGSFRLAILPIGAYEPRWFMRDQHMNPDDAVKAFLDCGADLACAHHFGTVQLTNEPIDAPARDHDAALKAAGIAPERFRRLSPGQVWTL
jgi:L-ascorbate metabolism protein UlaG (beta-lactamase superfamily)